MEPSEILDGYRRLDYDLESGSKTCVYNNNISQRLTSVKAVNCRHMNKVLICILGFFEPILRVCGTCCRNVIPFLR